MSDKLKADQWAEDLLGEILDIFSNYYGGSFTPADDFLAAILKHAPKPFPVGFPEPDDGGDSTIRYRNYRGEVATRRIIPLRIYWGSNEWHPEPQWLIEAHDLDKKAIRTFALSGFLPPEE